MVTHPTQWMITALITHHTHTCIITDNFKYKPWQCKNTVVLSVLALVSLSTPSSTPSLLRHWARLCALFCMTPEKDLFSFLPKELYLYSVIIWHLPASPDASSCLRSSTLWTSPPQLCQNLLSTLQPAAWQRDGLWSLHPTCCAVAGSLLALLHFSSACKIIWDSFSVPLVLWLTLWPPVVIWKLRHAQPSCLLHYHLPPSSVLLFRSCCYSETSTRDIMPRRRSEPWKIEYVNVNVKIS